MTTILLKVMLLFQRTLDSSYPGVTQDTRLVHNMDDIINKELVVCEAWQLPSNFVPLDK